MIHGTYAPSPSGWVRNQVEAIEAAGDTSVVGVGGGRVILMTMVGHSSGLVRKVPVMRVEEDGRYAAFGSLGGAPKDPVWVANLRANPHADAGPRSLRCGAPAVVGPRGGRVPGLHGIPGAHHARDPGLRARTPLTPYGT